MSAETSGAVPGIDRAGLAALLTERIGPSGTPLEVSLVSGGRSNLTYRLGWGGQRYVLRRPPLGDVDPRNHDVGREFRVLRAVDETPVPSPHPYFLDAQGAALGVPCYVMDEVPGRVLRAAADAPDMADPARLRALAGAMVGGIVALHDLDPADVGLADFGRPERYVARQVERWAGQWETRQQRSIPALDEVGARLRRALASGAVDPVPPRPYVVHGDYNVANVLVAPAEEFEAGPVLRAVLDWEMATLGHPLMDLGVLATYNGPHGDLIIEVEASVTSLPGFPPVEDLVADYADRSGQDVSAFPFFHVLAFYKVLVLTEDVRARFLRGETRGEGYEEMGRSVPAAAEILLEIARGSGLPGLAG